ncbi:MAG: OsmC family protein [Candidatus Omnitrophica bacterium]|nr:OsmC family protein [Candidatus Omnitrophota bacterium]
MKMQVEFNGKAGFKANIRDHELIIDLPEEMGGGNQGPTPPEAFVAAIASCSSFFAARYLKTANLDADGLSVDVDWDYDSEKKRVEHIYLSFETPNAKLGGRKKAFIAAAESCILHNTLHKLPEIKIEVGEE